MKRSRSDYGGTRELVLASRSRLARIGYDLVLVRNPRVQAVADAIAQWKLQREVLYVRRHRRPRRAP